MTNLGKPASRPASTPKKPAAISSGASNRLARALRAPRAVSASIWMISVICSAGWEGSAVSGEAGLGRRRDPLEDRTLSHRWISISSTRYAVFRPRLPSNDLSNATLVMAMDYSLAANPPSVLNARVAVPYPSLRGRYSTGGHVRAAGVADSCLGSHVRPAAAADVLSVLIRYA